MQAASLLEYRQPAVASTPAELEYLDDLRHVTEFVAWLRCQQAHGWWLVIEIDELYEAWSDQQKLPLMPRQKLRQIMLALPGIEKSRRRLSGPVLSSLAARSGLDRATVYWIPHSEPVAGPWPARGQRVAGQWPVSDRALASNAV